MKRGPAIVEDENLIHNECVALIMKSSKREHLGVVEWLTVMKLLGISR